MAIYALTVTPHISLLHPVSQVRYADDAAGVRKCGQCSLEMVATC